MNSTESPCDLALAIPPSLPGEVVILAEDGPDGGPCYEYRGAAIHANAGGTIHMLLLPGLPGCEDGQWREVDRLADAMAIIDAWLDCGEVVLGRVVTAIRSTPDVESDDVERTQRAGANRGLKAPGWFG